MRARIRGTAACLLTVGALPAAANESDIVLANDPGRAQVQAACSMCHSLDYIEMNSPFLDRAGWERTVNKMITVMGAPIPAEQVGEITDYLDKYYGRKAAPGPAKE